MKTHHLIRGMPWVRSLHESVVSDDPNCMTGSSTHEMRSRLCRRIYSIHLEVDGARTYATCNLNEAGHVRSCESLL